MPYELMGVAEIADLLAVSKQRAHQIAATDDFPAPIARLAAGPIWDRTHVEAWAQAAGRL